VAGFEARTRDKASPGLDRFVGRMGQFLVLVALAALSIAGIGIGNGVSSSPKRGAAASPRSRFSARKAAISQGFTCRRWPSAMPSPSPPAC
jgi:hypothetical protein